jgi:protoheme IX farnesyltransferase
VKIEEHVGSANWKDYLVLTKPRVVLLHMVTAAAAMYLAARGSPPLSLVLLTLLGGGLVAGAANVINCYFDRDIDGKMVRTRKRPLPAERLDPFQALIFSIIIGLAGLFVLSRFVNTITAILALGALAYYILIYTIWLKRRTYWSSLIGSGAGAFPPLIGWLAITQRLEATPFLLFAIIMLWTPPHYWSLAIFHQPDYEQASLSTIPGRHSTLGIGLSSLGLVAISLLLVPAAELGWLYLVTASITGLGMLVMAVNLSVRVTPGRAQMLFKYSILYLIILFGVMLIDRII